MRALPLGHAKGPPEEGPRSLRFASVMDELFADGADWHPNQTPEAALCSPTFLRADDVGIAGRVWMLRAQRDHLVTDTLTSPLALRFSPHAPLRQLPPGSQGGFYLRFDGRLVV